MKITNIALYIVLLTIFSSSNALTIDEIIHKTNHAAYYAGEDGRSEARMIIHDKQGNKQLRQFVILRKDKQDQGDQDFLVVFSRPADVRGTVFLVNKHINKDDDRWLYLPGLDLEKRISASDKRTSFVGSDFYYEDVSGRNPQLDNHELMNQDDSYYLLKSTPIDIDSVEFSYYKSKINKNNFIPMQIEYFDSQGNLIRKVESLEISTVQNIPTVIKSKVTNLETESFTTLEFRKPSYDLGLEAKTFSQRSLRSPPKKWLRLNNKK